MKQHARFGVLAVGLLVALAACAAPAAPRATDAGARSNVGGRKGDAMQGWNVQEWDLK